MFDFHPIIWLQSWASPALTAVMNGVSLLGYTRAYVAIAVLLAFGLRMRPAVALLVLISLNGAFTDIAKNAAQSPRPDWSHGQVRALWLYAGDLRQRSADTPTEVEDSYGFPSGHVSAATTFAVGLGVLLHWRRWRWAIVAGWILLMAVARMYLGRHFLGDVIGGFGVGLAVLAVGFGVLKVGHLARELCAHDPWPAHRILAVATILAGGALAVGLPDGGDAGRLLGAAIGVLVMVNHDVFEPAGSLRTRLMLVTTAAAAFGAAWFVMSLALREADPSSVSALRLCASALPNAALLTIPTLLPRRFLYRPLVNQLSRDTGTRRRGVS
jgi:membrane-associated phospholipid phosphatase